MTQEVFFTREEFETAMAEIFPEIEAATDPKVKETSPYVFPNRQLLYLFLNDIFQRMLTTTGRLH